MDHNYSKPWNWKPENSLIKQTKVVFKNSNSIYHEVPDDTVSDNDEIVVDDDVSTMSINHPKNEHMMSESESQANVAKPDSNCTDWEEKISK